MNGRIQRIELPGGAVVLARLSTAGGGYGEDDEDVGFVENATAKVRQLRELITEVGASVLEAAAAARPDEASVSFGVELTAKSGVALAVLAAGEAKASVQVTLTWQLKDQPAPPAPVTAPAGSHVPAPAPPTAPAGAHVPAPAPPTAPAGAHVPAPAPPTAPAGAHPPAPTTPPPPPPVPHE